MKQNLILTFDFFLLEGNTPAKGVGASNTKITKYKHAKPHKRLIWSYFAVSNKIYTLLINWQYESDTFFLQKFNNQWREAWNSSLQGKCGENLLQAQSWKILQNVQNARFFYRKFPVAGSSIISKNDTKNLNTQLLVKCFTQFY